MRSVKSLTPKQDAAVTELVEVDRSILVAPTGEGKTAIALYACHEMLEAGHLKLIIIACPPAVMPNYEREAAKWEELSTLNLVTLTGAAPVRSSAVSTPGAQILVVSLNNLNWLMELVGKRADGIIIDELTKASGSMSKKVRSRRWVKSLWWRVGMTANPATQDYQKLFHMMRLIVGTEIFGNNFQKYLQEYFFPDYEGRNWELRPGAEHLLLAKVAPYIHIIEDKKADKLPLLREIMVRFTMPTPTRTDYDKMSNDLVVGDVVAANQAVKSGKLRQLGSGFLYERIVRKNKKTGKPLVTNKVHRYDHARLAAFKKLFFLNLDRSSRASTPTPGKGTFINEERVVVFYEYEEHFEELTEAYPEAATSWPEWKERHAAGDAPRFLIVQINSLSHGVDGVQDYFHCLCFYHPIWSRDAMKQARDRVWRQGQKKDVKSVTLVCDDSIDDIAVMRVEGRAVWFEMLEDHLLKHAAKHKKRPAV